MTIAFRSIGAVSSLTGSATSVTAGLPGSLVDGDIVLLFVVTKPDTATIDTPANWSLVGTVAGGGGTAGNGTGPTRTAVFSREKDASWSSMPAVAVTNGNSSAAVAVAYSKDATKAWGIAASTGVYGTAATTTNASVTHGSNPGITAGDWCVVGYSNMDEAPTWSAQSITATGISAWGTATERTEALEATTGNDVGGMVFDRPVTTGTATAAPVTAATLSAAGRGTSVLVRLREETPTPDNWTENPVDSVGIVDNADVVLSNPNAPSQFIGASTAENAQASNLMTLNVPTGTQDGDLMFLVLATSQSATHNTPNGWTVEEPTILGGTAVEFTVYKRTASSEPASYQVDVTSTTTSATAVLAVWRGFTLRDSGTASSASNTASFTPGAVTGSASGDWTVGIAMARPNTASQGGVSSPAGWNQRANVTATGGTFPAAVAVADLVTTTPAAFTAPLGQQQWAGVALALTPTGGGSPTPTVDARVNGISRIKIKTGTATSVRLKIGTDQAVTQGVTHTTAQTPDARGWTTHDISGLGLTAGTTYYYRVAMTVSGTETLDTQSVVGKFKTPPSGQTSFAFCAASCCDAADSASMAAVATRGDDFFIHTGDMWYADGSGVTVDNYRAKMLAKLTAPNHAAVFATMPMSYTPSDHDGGMNDGYTGHTDTTARSAFNQVYREQIPVVPQEATTGVYHTFVWGRVRFIILDGRSFKVPNSWADDSSKTMLGATQKQWLKDTITAATEPLIMLVCDVPWHAPVTAMEEHWGGYSTERTELGNFFTASGKNIAYIAGDMHAVAYEDGSSTVGGIADFQAAPLNRTASLKGGPWDSVYPASGSALVDQYGRFVITDNGSSIQVAFTGYSSDNTARVTGTKTYTLSDNWTVDSTDPVGLTDSVTVALNDIQVQADAVGLVDSATLVTTGRVPVVDAVGLADNATVALTSRMSSVDNVGIKDTTNIRLSRPGTSTVHGLYQGFDSADPLDTDNIDVWAADNNIIVNYGHEFGDASQWSWFASVTNGTDWNNWVGAVPGRRMTYSEPLCAATNPSDFAGIVAGNYDSYFTSFGQSIQSYPNLRNMIIRLGWEFDGNTFPWQLPANATDTQLNLYKQAYNRAASLIKAEAPDVEFEWCPNAHLDNANRTLADMYPGDTYVDYIGLAVYDYYWPGGTPTQAQREAWLRDDTNGLVDQLALARTRGKPIAFTEWGLWPTTANTGGGDRPEFIRFMLDWMNDKSAAYSVYNNVNATQDHRLNTYPNSKAVYLSRFAPGYQNTSRDSAGLIDNATVVVIPPAGVVHTVTVSDSAGLVDAVSATLRHTMSSVDAVGMADTAVPAATHNLLPAKDTTGLADIAAVTETHNLLPSKDSTGLIDRQEPSLGMPVIAVDATGMADVAAASLAHTPPVPKDSTGLGDSATQAQAHSISVSDGVGLADNAAQSDIERLSVTDVAGLSESSTLEMGKTVVQSEPVGLAESLTIVGNWNDKSADPVGLVDVASVNLTGAGESIDSVGLGDAATIALVHGRNATDSTGMTDSPTVQLSHVAAVKDSAALSDTATPSLGHGRSTADLTGLADSAVVSRALGLAPQDGVGLGDTSSTAQTHALQASDGAGLSDASVEQMSATTNHLAQDHVGLSDTPEVTLYRLISISATDATGLADKSTHSQVMNLAATDTLTLTDAAAMADQEAHNILEAVGLSDHGVFALEMPTIHGDSAGLTDDKWSATVTGRYPVATDPHAEWGDPTSSIGSIGYVGSTAVIEEPS